jgi:hypothetical protein
VKKGRIYGIILTDKILSKKREKDEVWGRIKKRRNPRFSPNFLENQGGAKERTIPLER